MPSTEARNQPRGAAGEIVDRCRRRARTMLARASRWGRSRAAGCSPMERLRDNRRERRRKGGARRWTRSRRRYSSANVPRPGETPLCDIAYRRPALRKLASVLIREYQTQKAEIPGACAPPSLADGGWDGPCEKD